MSDHDAFAHILASLHDAMLDDTLWPATSALIEEACGAQGTALMVEAGPADALQLFFAHASCRGQDHTAWAREYREHYYPIDESVLRTQHLPDSRIVPISELYTAAELQTSATYNEALRQFNAQAGLNVRLDGPDGSHIIWALGDPVTPDGWAAPSSRCCKGCCPISANSSASAKPWPKPRP